MSEAELYIVEQTQKKVERAIEWLRFLEGQYDTFPCLKKVEDLLHLAVDTIVEAKKELS